MPEIIISIDKSLKAFLGTIKGKRETLQEVAERILGKELDQEANKLKWTKPTFRIVK
ncbi:hypothetical protein [Methylocaldum gracile]|jgi:3-methyladenine DNA glycosylase/8-oxoguanine DNA glycosylase|uniref:hypothetical protein n=1 Tax=Methylocaldum sp. 0917 TaxID=2485163 RepID=UPI0010D756EC